MALQPVAQERHCECECDCGNDQCQMIGNLHPLGTASESDCTVPLLRRRMPIMARGLPSARVKNVWAMAYPAGESYSTIERS
jgi:hypothetical protein